MVSTKKILSVVAFSLVLSVAIPVKRSEAIIVGAVMGNWWLVGGGLVLLLSGTDTANMNGAESSIAGFGLVLDEDQPSHVELAHPELEHIDVEHDLMFYGTRGERILSELKQIDQKLEALETQAKESGKELKPVRVKFPNQIQAHLYNGVPYDRSVQEPYECGMIVQVQGELEKVAAKGLSKRELKKRSPILLDTAKYMLEASSSFNSELTSERIEQMKEQGNCRFEG